MREHKRLSKRQALHVKLEKRLVTYAATAGAAGLGMLAAPRPALADIVVTNADIFVSPNTVVNLDLNHDGITDFQLAQNPGTFFSPTMFLRGLEAGNAVEGFVSYYMFIPHTVAARLKGGARIGGSFKNDAILGEARCCFATYYYGPWAHGGQGFLGLRFTIDGQIHYGWAELNVHNFYQTRDAYGEFLISYAYDTVPNQAIFAGEGLVGAALPSNAAPEPGTLGLLALGSLALGFWRQRKAVAGCQ